MSEPSKTRPRRERGLAARGDNPERRLAADIRHVDDDGNVTRMTMDDMIMKVSQERDIEATMTRERRAEVARMAQAMEDDRARRAFLQLEREMDLAIRRHWLRLKLQMRRRKAAPPGHEKRRTMRESRRPRPPRLPSYSRDIIDAHGRVGIYYRSRYVSGRTGASYLGCATAVWRYFNRAGAFEHDASGVPSRISNMGETVDEVKAACDLLESVQRASRANAKLFTTIEVSLPHDVSAEARLVMLHTACEKAFGQYGLPYAAIVHHPSDDGDRRNPHAHIIVFWRPTSRVGPYEWQVAKDLATEHDSVEATMAQREIFAEAMTWVAQAEGHKRIYTGLSHAARGLALKPTLKIGKDLVAAHRRGERVPLIERNADIIRRNEALLAAGDLDRMISDAERKRAELRAPGRRRARAVASATGNARHPEAAMLIRPLVPARPRRAGAAVTFAMPPARSATAAPVRHAPTSGYARAPTSAVVDQNDNAPIRAYQQARSNAVAGIALPPSSTGSAKAVTDIGITTLTMAARATPILRSGQPRPARPIPIVPTLPSRSTIASYVAAQSSPRLQAGAEIRPVAVNAVIRLTAVRAAPVASVPIHIGSAARALRIASNWVRQRVERTRAVLASIVTSRARLTVPVRQMVPRSRSAGRADLVGLAATPAIGSSYADPITTVTTRRSQILASAKVSGAPLVARASMASPVDDPFEDLRRLIDRGRRNNKAARAITPRQAAIEAACHVVLEARERPYTQAASASRADWSRLTPEQQRIVQDVGLGEERLRRAVAVRADTDRRIEQMVVALHGTSRPVERVDGRFRIDARALARFGLDAAVMARPGSRALLGASIDRLAGPQKPAGSAPASERTSPATPPSVPHVSGEHHALALWRAAKRDKRAPAERRRLAALAMAEKEVRDLVAGSVAPELAQLARDAKEYRDQLAARAAAIARSERGIE